MRSRGKVASSATVAAQPDRRNLLARGHLWASGRSLSSSSGADIQQQHGRTIRPHRPAPRAAAGLPPSQGGFSLTSKRRGGDHFFRAARPGWPREPAATLAITGFMVRAAASVRADSPCLPNPPGTRGRCLPELARTVPHTLGSCLARRGVLVLLELLCK